jgi:ribosomal protein S8
MICYNKELLKDIQSYHKTKEEILNIYKNNGFIDNDNYNNNDNLYATIQNDLSSYFNDDLAYMYCLSVNNMLRLKRLFIVKISKNLFDIIINFHFNFDN